MPQIVLFPTRIERSVALEAMPPDAAYVLQHADLKFLQGRVRRGGGYQRNQVSGSTNTVTNCAVFTRRDCKKFLLDCSDAGTVRMTPGDGQQPCGGPLPLFNNEETFDDTYDENFDQGPDPDAALPQNNLAIALDEWSAAAGLVTSRDLSAFFADGYAGPGREGRIFRMGNYSTFNPPVASGIIDRSGTLIVTERNPYVNGNNHEFTFNEATFTLVVDATTGGPSPSMRLEQGYIDSNGDEEWPS